MKQVIKRILNWSIWRSYCSVKRGELISNYTKGAGYYIPCGIIGVNPVGRIEEWKMRSGKTARYKLLSYETFSNPSDMIKSSEWAFLGYVGEKPVIAYSFDEYLDMCKPRPTTMDKGKKDKETND